jgi:hypothetical protein
VLDAPVIVTVCPGINVLSPTYVTTPDEFEIEAIVAEVPATVSKNVFVLSYLPIDTIGVGFAIPEASQLSNTLFPEATAVIVGDIKLKNVGRVAFTGWA